MLICPQQSTIVINNKPDNILDSSNILISSELASLINNTNETILIIDCGLPLRHTERRIQDSFLLNVNDKISRKRLTTRGLKSFLDTNQLNRLNQSNFIVLYDDTNHVTSCCNTPIQCQLSPSMKCIYDEIKRYDTSKLIYVLQSSFNDFYQHYPTLCYTNTINNDTEEYSLPTPIKQSDIDFCQLSEIFPGLYLGSSRDAENLNLLNEQQIKTVINISTTIPCHFENNGYFQYLRLPCQDSTDQNIVQYFEQTFQFIHQQLLENRNILVHCQGGISRSPSFVIGYLMKYHSKTFEEAYNLVKTKRKIISPNLSFLSQLTQYQKMLS